MNKQAARGDRRVEIGAALAAHRVDQVRVRLDVQTGAVPEKPRRPLERQARCSRQRSRAARAAVTGPPTKRTT